MRPENIGSCVSAEDGIGPAQPDHLANVLQCRSVARMLEIAPREPRPLEGRYGLWIGNAARVRGRGERIEARELLATPLGDQASERGLMVGEEQEGGGGAPLLPHEQEGNGREEEHHDGGGQLGVEPRLA